MLWPDVIKDDEFLYLLNKQINKSGLSVDVDNPQKELFDSLALSV